MTRGCGSCWRTRGKVADAILGLTALRKLRTRGSFCTAIGSFYSGILVRGMEGLPSLRAPLNFLTRRLRHTVMTRYSTPSDVAYPIPLVRLRVAGQILQAVGRSGYVDR